MQVRKAQVKKTQVEVVGMATCDCIGVEIRGQGGTERAGEDDGRMRWKEKATCELGVFYHIGLV